MIDTPARPTIDELKTISEGCDLLVLPTSPDVMALSTTLQMVDALKALSAHYRILLTLIPPPPSRAGEDARAAIEKAGLPIFQSGIRRLAVFQRAALEGVPVNAVKDPYAKIAWRGYVEVGREILS